MNPKVLIAIILLVIMGFYIKNKFFAEVAQPAFTAESGCSTSVKKQLGKPFRQEVKDGEHIQYYQQPGEEPKRVVVRHDQDRGEVIDCP